MNPQSPPPSSNRRPLRLPGILCCVMLVVPVVSCASAQKLVKAKPAKAEAFLEKRTELRADPADTGPFHVIRRTTSPDVLKIAQQKPAINVLPVDLRYLKAPTRKKMPAAEYAETPVVKEIAALLRTRFQEEANRVAAPARNNALTLHLALTEFTPTSAVGNAAKTAAGFFIGPFASLASPFTKGTIAIEGEVRDPATGRVVFQFADRESDPLTFLSVRSYQSTAFAKMIIDQWAAQFPPALRTPAGVKQKDAPFIRLNPL